MTAEKRIYGGRTRKAIPIIDVFAGPGGLGEGFGSLKREDGSPAFRLALSIEKDPVAHRTLTLRAAFRSFGPGRAPEAYYDYARGFITRSDLEKSKTFKEALDHALTEARCEELGTDSHATTDGWIRAALGDQGDWVLIGGPPCQAYSMAGRSRLRPLDAEKFEQDKKHFLYKEYLRIIEKFRPAVFVMENVKGMLSSMHGGTSIFDRILKDLSHPAPGVEYTIHPLVEGLHLDTGEKQDFVIRSELYGVPQARHRVILLGIRKNFAKTRPKTLRPAEKAVSVKDVIGRLPKMRSRLSTRLSREEDSAAAWLSYLAQLSSRIAKLKGSDPDLVQEISSAVARAQRRTSTGAAYIPHAKPSEDAPAVVDGLQRWYHDPRLGGVLQHEARAHMASDLQRYLFSAAYARTFGQSPNLKVFPDFLLPDHRNAEDDDTPFLDRFRVQRWDRPSTTVVSHISKDGHYYIHPDPSQCRSLTVREAARLQTFPDNYFFEGNRTQQYHQIGNAVPPWLARQIGQIVLSLHDEAA